MKIYLDDIREAPNGWRQFWNAEQFLHWLEVVLKRDIEEGRVSKRYILCISFDHDLHREHYAISQEAWAANPCPDGLVHATGYDACVGFIAFAKKHNLERVLLYCHSANVAGKANIERIIDQYNQLFQQ
jgi:hypothetical protein